MVIDNDNIQSCQNILGSPEHKQNMSVTDNELCYCIIYSNDINYEYDQSTVSSTLSFPLQTSRGTNIFQRDNLCKRNKYNTYFQFDNSCEGIALA